MSDVTLRFAKELVLKRLIPSIGFGDRMAIYGIGPEFGLSSIISGGAYEDQPPQFPARRGAEVLELLRESRSGATPGRVRRQTYDLVRELAPRWREIDSARARWARQVESAARPKPPGSNLSCALDAIDAYFRSSDNATEDKALFVISDLIEERPAMGRCAAAGAGSERLRGVRIALLYPHDSRHDWNAILGYWRRFLGDRRIEVYPISAVLNQESILPPNPLSGLEKYVIADFWTNFSALLGLGGRIVAAIGVVFAGIGAAVALLGRARPARQSSV